MQLCLLRVFIFMFMKGQFKGVWSMRVDGCGSGVITARVNISYVLTSARFDLAPAVLCAL